MPQLRLPLGDRATTGRSQTLCPYSHLRPGRWFVHVRGR